MDPGKLQTYIVLSLTGNGCITLISVLSYGWFLTEDAKLNRVEIASHIDTVLHDMGHTRLQFPGIENCYVQVGHVYERKSTRATKQGR